MTWRNISQEEIGEIWKGTAAQIEEEVLAKTRRKTATEKPTEEEVCLLSGGSFEE